MEQIKSMLFVVHFVAIRLRKFGLLSVFVCNFKENYFHL